MAEFEGTIEDFTRFIGGYTRNKVQYITTKYRKKKGKCEDCNSRTKKLDAAHIKGKERPVLISNILSNFIEGKKIRINLKEFEDLFIEAHSPIEETIRILCKECHHKYDNQNVVFDSIYEVNDTLNIEEINIEENKIISDLIFNSEMNKSKAIDLIKDKTDFDLNYKNTIYSNKNSATDVWWLEPTKEKFNLNLYFVLNNSKINKLFIFEIPERTITNPDLYFEPRNEKEVSKIIIPISDSEFTDKKGFSFNQFLIKEINY